MVLAGYPYLRLLRRRRIEFVFFFDSVVLQTSHMLVQRECQDILMLRHIVVLEFDLL